MPVTAAKLLEAFPGLLQDHSGDFNITFLGPCAQEKPKPGHLAFVSDPTFLAPLVRSEVAGLVVLAKLSEKMPKTTKPILLSPNPYLAMALVNQKFFPVPFLRQGFSDLPIHPSALIHPNAELHPSVRVGPNTVIYGGTKVDEGTFIGANCVIESNVTIGKNCFIHHMVYVGHTTTLGNAVEIKPNSTIGSDGFGYAHDDKGNHYRLPHYGPLIIEDDVHIGANVNIDRGTFEPARISRGTKVDNHCHFGHNIQVGENTLITAGFIAAGSSKIGANCVFAGRSSINGHISLCDGVTLGALSAATNDITKPGTYLGFPPIPYREGLRVQSTLQHLPKMRKSLDRVMKHLGLSESDGE